MTRSLLPTALLTAMVMGGCGETEPLHLKTEAELREHYPYVLFSNRHMEVRTMRPVNGVYINGRLDRCVFGFSSSVYEDYGGMPPDMSKDMKECLNVIGPQGEGDE